MAEEHPFTWNFGDGSPISHDKNPAHIFEKPGTYTVTLTVSGPGGSNSSTSNISVRERAAPPGAETVAEKIRRYFPWRGDGIGLNCFSCCTKEGHPERVGYIGNFLMLYPCCNGSEDRIYPPDHIIYGYPVGFCYPLLAFFGGATLETAEYPEVWTGTLNICGERFNLDDPKEFFVNKNGVGIVPPQQYGWRDEETGRYWSLARIATKPDRPVEHLPDVVIYPNRQAGQISVRHESFSDSFTDPGLFAVTTNGGPEGSIINAETCSNYGITPEELADPETMLSRCFCCGLGFPLAWLNASDEFTSSSWEFKGVFPNAKPTMFYGIRGVKIF